MRQFILYGALVAMLLISGAHAAQNSFQRLGLNAFRCYQCQPNPNNNFCLERNKQGYPSASSQVSCTSYCMTATGNVKASGRPDQRFTIVDCVDYNFVDSLGMGSGNPDKHECKSGDDAKNFWQASNRFLSAYVLPLGLLDTINFCKCAENDCNTVGAQLIAVGGCRGNECIDDVDTISLSPPNHPRALVLPIKAGSFGSSVVNNTIFVIGGATARNDSSWLLVNSFFAYNTASNTWKKLRDFSYKVCGNAVVAVNGAIYSLGGVTQNNGYMNYTYKYDTRTRIWWRMPTPLPVKGEYICTVADQTNIYMVDDTGDVFQSEDGARTWKALSVMNEHHSSKARSYASCALLPNGLIMVAGGIVEGKSVNSVDIYDIAENSWASMTPMTRRRVQAGIAVIPESDSVVICGGYITGDAKFYGDCEMFSMTENQWSFTDFKLNSPRMSFGLFVV